MKITENRKNILKIFGIWSLVNIISYFIFTFLSVIGSRDLKTFSEAIGAAIMFAIISPFAVLLVFAPGIIALYFLFKKVKDSLTRIYLIAFLIPFTNLIYLFIEHYFLIGSDGMISMTIGFIMLFMFLPLTLITTFCIPKTLLPIKRDMITTQLLIIALGWIMVVLSGILINLSDNIINSIKVKKYETIIKNIEEYKTKHKKYPDKIEDTIKSFRNFEYSVENNNQDYVLVLYNSSNFRLIHCSSNEHKECELGYHYGYYNRKFGKWVKSVYDD